MGVVGAWAAVWYCAVIEVNAMLGGDHADGNIYFANAWLFLTLFWGELVIMNIAFTTTAGAVADSYFSPADVTSEGVLCCRPAAWSALRRACTTSLGSIAFGSLIVAIIKTLKTLARQVQRETDNSALKLVFCCLACILDCIERFFQWLTEWAFVYAAIYGTGFVESGTRVFELLSHSGIGAVTTTVLVDPVLSLASVVGLGCGLGLGYAAVLVTQVYAHAFGCVVGGLVGFAVVSVGLSPVYAGCKSLFVCIAEEPDVLAQRAPELHGKIREMAPMTDSAASLARP